MRILTRIKYRETSGTVVMTTSMSNEPGTIQIEPPETGWMFKKGPNGHVTLVNISGLSIVPVTRQHTKFVELISDPSLVIKDGLILNRLKFISNSGFDVVTDDHPILSTITKGKSITKQTMDTIGQVFTMNDKSTAIYICGGTQTRPSACHTIFYIKALLDQRCFDITFGENRGHFFTSTKYGHSRKWATNYFPVEKEKKVNRAEAIEVIKKDWILPQNKFCISQLVFIQYNSMTEFTKIIKNHVEYIDPVEIEYYYHYFLNDPSMSGQGTIAMHQVTLDNVVIFFPVSDKDLL